MLTKQRKGTIATLLTIKGQGEEATFKVTYHNRRQSEVQAKLDEALAAMSKPDDQISDDDRNGLANVVLFMVESWETEYEVSLVGIKEMEDDRPGLIAGILAGFHDARKVEKVKN